MIAVNSNKQKREFYVRRSVLERTTVIRCCCDITKTACPIQYSAVKNENCMGKKSLIFNIFGQNIDCGYTLEMPCRIPTIYVLEQKKKKKKKKKIGTPLYTPGLLSVYESVKVEIKGRKCLRPSLQILSI